MEYIEVREQRHIGLSVCAGVLGVVAGAVMKIPVLIPVGLAAGALVLLGEHRHIVYGRDGIHVGRNRHFSWDDVLQAGIMYSGETPHERMLVLTMKGGITRNSGESFKTWLGKNRRLGADRFLLSQRYRAELAELISCCYGPLDFDES